MTRALPFLFFRLLLMKPVVDLGGQGAGNTFPSFRSPFLHFQLVACLDTRYRVQRLLFLFERMSIPLCWFFFFPLFLPANGSRTSQTKHPPFFSFFFPLPPLLSWRFPPLDCFLREKRRGISCQRRHPPDPRIFFALLPLPTY